MNKNSSMILAQQDLLRSKLRQFVGLKSPYALVDFPDHSNVGDSAIWLGETRLLQEITSCRPKYVCTAESFDAEEFRNTCPNGPIFIHGGGNFGDIWRTHQDFRELLLANFKERTIIQMPQSIHFRDTAQIGRCADLIADHPAFTLLVRDLKSQEFAAEKLRCSANLTPDAALGLGPIQRPHAASLDAFLLLRTDREKRGYNLEAINRLSKIKVDDWLDEPSWQLRAISLRNRVTHIITPSSNRSNERVSRYEQRAWHRVNRGCRQLAQGKKVITDRLHAHILSFAMGIPHVALDNDYGKVSGYIDAWTGASDMVRKATSMDEAVQELARLPA